MKIQDLKSGEFGILTQENISTTIFSASELHKDIACKIIVKNLQGEGVCGILARTLEIDKLKELCDKYNPLNYKMSVTITGGNIVPQSIEYGKKLVSYFTEQEKLWHDNMEWKCTVNTTPHVDDLDLVGLAVSGHY